MTVVFVAVTALFNFYLQKSPASISKLNFLDLATKSFLEEEINYTATSLLAANPVASEMAAVIEGDLISATNQFSSLIQAGNPLSNIVPTRGGILLYKAQKGDTLSRIAASFGISLNTILWANEKLKPNQLQPGQEIIILPTTGVLHQIQSEETLEIIAAKYSVSPQRILSANVGLVPAKLIPGTTVIIPNSRPIRTGQLAFLASLPLLPGYFAFPTTGWNWGKLHNYNAVDLANACGTPVYAAAEGLVVESARGWNEGYGNYIQIEHPNATKTKYAHNQKNLVSIGDYVLKGDQIAVIGNTGLTHGPTGCHLHFEVRGAKNPFAK